MFSVIFFSVAWLCALCRSTITQSICRGCPKDMLKWWDMFREDSFCMFSFVLDLKNQKTQPASACNYALASNNTFMLRCIAYCQGSETCKGIHMFLSVLNMDSACFRIIHGFTRTQNLNANLFFFFIFFVIFPFTCWTCTGRTRTFLHFEAATVRPRQKRPCCDEQRWRVRWTTCLFWPRETLGEKKEIWKFRSYVFEIAFAWPLLIPSDTRPAPLILICFFREAWAVGFSVRN